MLDLAGYVGFDWLDLIGLKLKNAIFKLKTRLRSLEIVLINNYCCTTEHIMYHVSVKHVSHRNHIVPMFLLYFVTNLI